MDKKIRTIIIDDETKGQNLLKELINRYCPEAQVVAIASNGIEGLKMIKEHGPDCVLLDINMPKMNGFEMLEKLEQLNCEIVFVTAHNEYAIRAFKYAAFDYLLKPVDPEELIETFKRLKLKLHQPKNKEQTELLKQLIRQPQKVPTRLTIVTSDAVTVVNMSDILYLQADGPYTYFYLANGEKLTASLNLQKYEDLLVAPNFFRTHNSFLVNMFYVKKFNKADLKLLLTNGALISVSKRRKEEFLQALSFL